jgi:hypothetical protein
MVIGCILCMCIHTVRIHQYHTRLVRSEITEVNIQIIIFSIYCPYAKAAGKQYTKRILPYFVTPECNICLVNAIEFYKISHRAGKIAYELSAGILGTVNLKTIKWHYAMAVNYIRATVLELVLFLATIPNLVTLEEPKPSGDNDLDLISNYTRLINQAAEKVGRGPHIKQIRIVHRTYILQKTRKPGLQIPMNLVVACTFFNDTS